MSSPVVFLGLLVFYGMGGTAHEVWCRTWLESVKRFFKESATCGVLFVIYIDFNYPTGNIFYYDH